MEYWCSVYEIAMLAAEVEAKGMAFYKYLQGIADDPAIAEVCAFFAAQEQVHQAKFLEIAEAHRLAQSEQFYVVDVRSMLKASVHELAQVFDKETLSAGRTVSVDECLAIAMRVEVTAVSVYMKMMEQQTSSFAGILADVLVEEREHIRMIQQAQKKCHD